MLVTPTVYVHGATPGCGGTFRNVGWAQLEPPSDYRGLRARSTERIMSYVPYYGVQTLSSSSTLGTATDSIWRAAGTSIRWRLRRDLCGPRDPGKGRHGLPGTRPRFLRFFRRERQSRTPPSETGRRDQVRVHLRRRRTLVQSHTGSVVPKGARLCAQSRNAVMWVWAMSATYLGA